MSPALNPRNHNIPQLSLLHRRGKDCLANQMNKLWHFIYFAFWKHSLKGKRDPKFSAAAVWIIFKNILKEAAWVAMENGWISLNFTYWALGTFTVIRLSIGSWPCLAAHSQLPTCYYVGFAKHQRDFPGWCSPLNILPNTLKDKLLFLLWHQRRIRLEKCQEHKNSITKWLQTLNLRVSKRFFISPENVFP